MGKIIKNNVVYSGVPDEVITAWETEDVQDLPEITMGDADISSIGDGSITGAIAEHEDNINDIDETIGNTNISSIGDGTVTGAISSLNSNSSKNNFGSVVSLDTYTSSDYTIPSDGYVLCNCSASSTSKAIADVYGASSGVLRFGGWSNSAYPVYTCFVKKGMRVRVVVLENSGHVNYFPLA